MEARRFSSCSCRLRFFIGSISCTRIRENRLTSECPCGERRSGSVAEDDEVEIFGKAILCVALFDGRPSFSRMAMLRSCATCVPLSLER